MRAQPAHRCRSRRSALSGDRGEHAGSDACAARPTAPRRALRGNSRRIAPARREHRPGSGAAARCSVAPAAGSGCTRLPETTLPPEHYRTSVRIYKPWQRCFWSSRGCRQPGSEASPESVLIRSKRWMPRPGSVWQRWLRCRMLKKLVAASHKPEDADGVVTNLSMFGCVVVHGSNGPLGSASELEVIAQQVLALVRRRCAPLRSEPSRWPARFRWR
jgi:hypothetical protein